VLLFFALFIQFLPQTSVAEAFIVPLLFLACAYPLTTYLSKNLLRKAIVRKGTAIFAVWFFLFSVLVGFLFFCCSFLFVILENEGYFPGTPLFSREEYFFYNLLVFITVGIFINLCFCGLRFFEENLKMQKSLLETQLQTLQNQITPHFMFNVLNHIHVVMQSDVDLASSLLVKYAEILRYQLYSGKKEAIPVEQEVQFLKDFVDIEKIRWEDKLNVQCSWKIENGKKEIVPLLLITFVENAFKHVSRETAGKGFVKIDLEQKGNTICLEVKNSKSTFPAKKRHSGLGLKNTRERLDILYPDAYSLSVEETDATYYSRLTIKA
jgi:NADH:ubiquinone oxidoreductase subunit 5 (subunit L)/multisubunit Na+/H+ antiporter MnhA subunit